MSFISFVVQRCLPCQDNGLSSYALYNEKSKIRQTSKLCRMPALLAEQNGHPFEKRLIEREVHHQNLVSHRKGEDHVNEHK